MRRIATVLLALIVVGLIAAEAVVWATAPVPIADDEVGAHTPDPANGELLFHAGGCLSCHKPVDGNGIDPALPAGGRPLESPAGKFYPPNITPHGETGIGKWTNAQFVSAMMRGVSPSLKHYFPSFPYTSYRHMTVSDVLDLKAYLFTLPPVENAAPAPTLPFVDVLRRLMGPWKWAAMGPIPVPPDGSKDELWNRGAYLVQGPGHCSECHTPRNLAMMPKTSQFLAGGPHPEGKGTVPSLRDLIGRKRYKDTADLGFALAFGETYGYEDISSGGMAAVQENIGRLPEDDVKAIATFLTGLE